MQTVGMQTVGMQTVGMQTVGMQTRKREGKRTLRRHDKLERSGRVPEKGVASYPFKLEFKHENETRKRTAHSEKT